VPLAGVLRSVVSGRAQGGNRGGEKKEAGGAGSEGTGGQKKKKRKWIRERQKERKERKGERKRKTRGQSLDRFGRATLRRRGPVRPDGHEKEKGRAEKGKKGETLKTHAVWRHEQAAKKKKKTGKRKREVRGD